MNIVFIGAPGSGKTRLGKRVARHLGRPFIDTDKRIVADHGSIAEIFATQGEPWFREREREAVEKALAEDNSVISLGGGAILDERTRRDLADHSVVLVTVTAEAVAKRIRGAKRPLLAGGIDAWIALVDARRELYEALATRQWDTSNRPIDSIAEEIADWARETTP